MNTQEYTEALVWLDQQFPNIGSLGAREVARCFNVGMTTARATCKRFGVKIGDYRLPKPIAAKMIAGKMKVHP